MLVIIANILGFLSGIFCIISTFTKTKKKLIITQSLDSSCNLLACILLGGISGATVTICGLARNLLCYFKEISKKTSFVIVVITGVLAIYVNGGTPIGILPVLAAVIYAWIICTKQDVKSILIGLIINNSLWLIYKILILNYVGAIMNAIIIATSLYNVLKKKKDE